MRGALRWARADLRAHRAQAAVARGEHDRQTGRLVAAKLHSRCLPQTLQVADGIR